MSRSTFPPDGKVCPGCSLPFVAFPGEETKETIEIDVRAYRRLYHRKRYRKTCSCPGPPGIVTAPAPASLIPKGLLGISVFVEILAGKYAFHTPLGRILAFWEQSGLVLSPGTVDSALVRIACLFLPLYEALLARSRTASLSHAGETRFHVFEEIEGKESDRWWLWCFLTVDAVVFVLDPTRSASVPKTHVKDFKGFLIVDRYAAYKATAGVEPGLVLCFCWAHARRDFVKARARHPDRSEWADSWKSLIARLYRANAHRLVALEEDSGRPRSSLDAPLLEVQDEMNARARREIGEDRLPPGCRAALQSLLSHWKGLTVFADFPQVPMDNNIAERAQRGVAVGRKVFYGAGSLVSGHMAAHLYSLFGTWSNAGLNLRPRPTPTRPMPSEKVFGRSTLPHGSPGRWIRTRKQLLARPLPDASPFADTG